MLTKHKECRVENIRKKTSNTKQQNLEEALCYVKSSWLNLKFSTVIFLLIHKMIFLSKRESKAGFMTSALHPLISLSISFSKLVNRKLQCQKLLFISRLANLCGKILCNLIDQVRKNWGKWIWENQYIGIYCFDIAV